MAVDVGGLIVARGSRDAGTPAQQHGSRTLGAAHELQRLSW
jgi:hypothetical protein